MIGKGDSHNGWKTSTSQALSKVCRKRWRTLELAAGSPTPPMRINCANALLGGELYLFGGLNAGPSKSLWALNIRERRWSPVHSRRGQAPAPRQGHSMCWDGLSSLWVFGGQGMETSRADSSRTHQGVKIRSLAKRTCFNDFFEFDTKKLEWRDHVQAGVCPTSRRGHTATLVVGRRTIDDSAGLHQTERTSELAAVAAGASTGTINTLGGEGSTNSDSGGGANRSQVRGEAEGPDGRNSSGSTSSITPRSPSRATPDQGGQQGLGGRSPRKGGGGGSRKGGRADVVGGGEVEDEPRESREMFVIGGAGTDPIRNMEVVYPQLWIFDFNRSAWTCVEAAGVGKGAGGGGKSKGNGILAAGGDGGGGSSGGGGGSRSASGLGPPAVFDHTATLVGGKHIVVIGGVMVGRGLNSKVYMLTLDTLQWAILDPHPLGFPAPAIHGHTTVEDPARVGRLIVFGGQGGNNWNTQVLTCDWKKNMWSIALCDTEAPTNDDAKANNTATSTTNNNRKYSSNSRIANGGRRGSSLHRVTILDDPVVGKTEATTLPSPAASDNNNESSGQTGARDSVVGSSPAPTSILTAGGSKGDGFAAADGVTAVVEPAMVTMPHQRHGHTCFVWDPRDTARTSNDAAAYGDGGRRGSSMPPKQEQSNSMQSRRGGGGGGGSGGANKPSPKRSRGGGGSGGAGGNGSKSGPTTPSRGKGRSGTSWNRNKQTPPDESLPFPCIVAFGGSALRTGGGYAQAELHVLETPKPEGGNDEEESDGEEGGGGILEALESSANTRKQSFNRFQACTKSVLLKVHSLRQLGKEKLTFGDSYDPGDLSYVDFKVRSVILGEGNKKLEGAPHGSDNSNPNQPPTGSTASGKKITDGAQGRDKPPHPGAGRLGVFPTGYEQVKAFLADARPANARRPVSAPAHIESGGSIGGGLAVAGGSGGGGVDGVTRSRSRGRGGLEATRRPGTAGASLGRGGSGAFGDEYQRSSLPPVTGNANCSPSSSLVARPGSRSAADTSSGTQRATSGRHHGGNGNTNSTSTCNDGPAGEGRIPTAVAAALGGSATTGAEGISHHPVGGGVANSGALFYHRSAGGGAAGGAGGAVRGRVPMQGSRPIVLPKPTMAAHNGRLLMENEWAKAGLY